MPFTIEKESDPLYLEGREKGIEKGIEKRSFEIARSLLDILDDATIAKKLELTIIEVKKIRLDYCK